MPHKLVELVNKYGRNIRASRWFVVLVAMSYIFFTAYYMGPSVSHCNSTLYGFGDDTAGPVWRFSLKPLQAPLGSYEHMTNYPVGENLYSPVNYSLSGQSYAIWGLSRAINPICGYNIFNMVGFVASALVMFGFIYSLFRNKWIAWLAGYAVSFSPYYQMKVGGHPGYGFQALLIAIAWAFFNLVKKRRKRDAVLLGVSIAACFYFDPYFSLLAMTVIAPLVAVWVILFARKLKRRSAREYTALWQQLRLFIAAMGIFLLLAAPLAIVVVGYGKQISATVAANRGNVLFEAKSCSNLPYEYALPFVLHPIFGRLLGKTDYTKLISELHSGFTCGIGEDTVGVSLAVLSVIGVGLVVFAWEKANKRRLKFPTEYDKRLVFFGLSGIGLFAAIMALPPIRMGGILPTPSDVLLHLTSTWRTLTRLYVVVNFAAVSLSALFLVFIQANFKAYKRLLGVGFVLIFLCIFVEYQAFLPFSGNKLSTFNYRTDVPITYTWLAKQRDIRTIAEYPLERSGGESNAMAYYLSMQLAHGKVLFNGNIPTTYEESLRESLKNISDSQTLSVLSSLGVDAVVIHGIDEQTIRDIPGLEVVYAAQQAPFNILAFTPLVQNDVTVVARIKQQTPVKTMLAFASGFVRNANIIKSAADWEYENLNYSIMDVVGLPGDTSGNTHTPAKQCFSVRMSGDTDSALLTVITDGHPAISTVVGPEFQRIQVVAGDFIQLTNAKGFNMRIKDLGCGGNE